MRTATFSLPIAASFPASRLTPRAGLDRNFATGIALQFLAGVGATRLLPLLAPGWSPAAADDQANAALLSGGLIAALPVLAGWYRAGAKATPFIMAVGLALSCLLWIDISSGALAAYMLPIVAATCLALYRQTAVLALFGFILTAHHAISLASPRFAPAGFDEPLALQAIWITLGLILLRNPRAVPSPNQPDATPPARSGQTPRGAAPRPTVPAPVDGPEPSAPPYGALIRIAQTRSAQQEMVPALVAQDNTPGRQTPAGLGQGETKGLIRRTGAGVRGDSLVELSIAMAVVGLVVGTGFQAMSRALEVAQASRLETAAVAAVQQRVSNLLNTPWEAGAATPSALEVKTTVEPNVPLLVDSTTGATQLSCEIDTEVSDATRTIASPGCPDRVLPMRRAIITARYRPGTKAADEAVPRVSITLLRAAR